MRVDSPCWYYGSAFDAEDIIRRHAASPEADAGSLTNYIGVRIPSDVFPAYVGTRLGQVEDAPIPGNWHADIAEWSSALRAVELAGQTFRMIELGCGWGCWLNNCGMAARRMGKEIELIGIEADEKHVRLAQQILTQNGFRPDQFTLIRAIAAAKTGYALFPKIGDQTHWGLEPRLDVSAAERLEAVASGAFDELPMVGLDELTEKLGRIDLLHLDIQGGELDFITQSLVTLQREVATLLIGTHGREIEGALMTLLASRGWRLETEKPAMLEIRGTGPYVQMDGVQFWRNLSLLP